MPAAISINPTDIYDDALLSDLLGVSAETLARARRSHALRYTRKGQRILYMGSWVLQWLADDSEGRCVETTPEEVARGA